MNAQELGEIRAADEKTPIAVDRFGGMHVHPKMVRVHGYRAIVHRRQLLGYVKELQAQIAELSIAQGGAHVDPDSASR
jgi:hypothetical protein